MLVFVNAAMFSYHTEAKIFAHLIVLFISLFLLQTFLNINYMILFVVYLHTIFYIFMETKSIKIFIVKRRFFCIDHTFINEGEYPNGLQFCDRRHNMTKYPAQTRRLRRVHSVHAS